MAVAEARAAWQRTANRCFVQEDAKRAPKLACCPSSAASTKHVDAGPANAENGQDYLIPGFIPLNRNPSYTNLPPNSRWWLQLQPNYGFQRCLTNEQLNILEADMETFRADLASLNSKSTGVHLQSDNEGVIVSENLNFEPSFDSHSRIYANCIKKDPGVNKQELKAVYSKNVQEPFKVKDAKESYKVIQKDNVESVGSKQSIELPFKSGSPWIEDVKSEPWWRTTDRDELASFVAQRSLELFENCDLPQPREKHVKRGPYTHPVECFDHDGVFTSSVDWKSRTDVSSTPTVHVRGSDISGSSRVYNCSVEGLSDSTTDRPISNNTAEKGMARIQTTENDPSKAQLLEALRHSQTRAREAEKAARQAYEEKEHVVKLFFRQASHLFAYKQWLQLLQLENLYFQIKKNKNQPISALLPAVLPWVPLKARQMRKSWQRTPKGKQPRGGRPRCCISKYAIVFALGLSLVGAGFLLGWSLGWMLPAL